MTEQDFEKILTGLAGRFGAQDPQTILADVKESIKPLEALCQEIEAQESFRIDIETRTTEFLAKTTDEFHDWEGQLLLQIGEDFFSSINEAITYHISRTVLSYQDIFDNYELFVRKAVQRVEEAAKDNPNAATALLQLTPRINSIVGNSTKLYADILLHVSSDLEKIYQHIAIYNKYLKQRFVKHEEKTEPKIKRMLFVIGDEETEVKYTKIKLIEGNPVLTDALLSFVDNLPIAKEREIKEKGKKTKKVKEFGKYATNQSKDALIKMAHPQYLAYLQDPTRFFQGIGGIMQDFYDFFKDMKPLHEQILANPRTRVLLQNTEIHAQLKKADLQKTITTVGRIAETDFDDIVQNPDDLYPENKKERDHFKLRDNLLTLVYDTLKELADAQAKTPLKKKKTFYDKAEETVKKAIEIKAEINELLLSETARRLRQNKTTDNEYYEGVQGDIHTEDLFSFERKPAPTTKLDEVVGASFETAKTHLKQIIETAEYPHIMRLSAPDRKVRSNILLIGPYGCGKTHLAKAVCGDKRVIGASVSVSSTLTAWMHESVNNVRRVYDASKKLYIEGREQKPVVLILDEFDAWFAQSGHGFGDTDMHQMKNVLQEILDGMGDYHGIITLAMTNEPLAIPPAILRRFRYVDIVGQLNEEERAKVLQNNLEKTLPIAEDVPQHYLRWAKKLEGAVGDVIRKVADEIHAETVPAIIKAHPKEAVNIQRTLSRHEMKRGTVNDKDIAYLKRELGKYQTITVADVDRHVDTILTRPQIVLQINKAKKLYEDAQQLLEALSSGKADKGFGFRGTKDPLFGIYETD